jgi:hypothetical protein
VIDAVVENTQAVTVIVCVDEELEAKEVVPRKFACTVWEPGPRMIGRTAVPADVTYAIPRYADPSQ